jgi:hypothetical protein
MLLHDEFVLSLGSLAMKVIFKNVMESLKTFGIDVYLKGASPMFGVRPPPLGQSE